MLMCQYANVKGIYHWHIGILFIGILFIGTLLIGILRTRLLSAIAKFRRRLSRSCFEVFAQERLTGEIHLLSNFLYREIAAQQQRFDFHNHHARNPLSRGASADALNHFG